MLEPRAVPVLAGSRGLLVGLGRGGLFEALRRRRRAGSSSRRNRRQWTSPHQRVVGCGAARASAGLGSAVAMSRTEHAAASGAMGCGLRPAVHNSQPRACTRGPRRRLKAPRNRERASIRSNWALTPHLSRFWGLVHKMWCFGLGRMGLHLVDWTDALSFLRTQRLPGRRLSSERPRGRGPQAPRVPLLRAAVHHLRALRRGAALHPQARRAARAVRSREGARRARARRDQAAGRARAARGAWSTGSSPSCAPRAAPRASRRSASSRCAGCASSTRSPTCASPRCTGSSRTSAEFERELERLDAEPPLQHEHLFEPARDERARERAQAGSVRTRRQAARLPRDTGKTPAKSGIAGSTEGNFESRRGS